MIDNELLDRCTELALDIMPELSERPLYVIDAAMLDGLPIRRDCLGFATTRIDMNWADRLGDKWRGPGPTIALFENETVQAYGAANFAAAIYETMVHEVAHLAELVPTSYHLADDLTWMDTPSVRDFQLQSAARQIETITTEADEESHGKRWIRLLCHCWYRAIAAGWDIECSHLMTGSRTQCEPKHFITALMKELIAKQHATFSEIAEIEPTAAYEKIWNPEGI